MMGRFFRSLYVGRMTEYFSGEATKEGYSDFLMLAGSGGVMHHIPVFLECAEDISIT